MATIEINNWLQEAIEAACENHFKKLYSAAAKEAGDNSPYVTSSCDRYGLTISITYGLYPRKIESKSEFLTPQEAFKIFMESRNEQ